MLLDIDYLLLGMPGIASRSGPSGESFRLARPPVGYRHRRASRVLKPPGA